MDARIDFLVATRKKKGLTQTQVGKGIGVTKQTVSRWEKGDRIPSYRYFLEWAHILNVPLEQLEKAK